jgi:hypothetical protein
VDKACNVPTLRHLGVPGAQQQCTLCTPNDNFSQWVMGSEARPRNPKANTEILHVVENGERLSRVFVWQLHCPQSYSAYRTGSA